MGCRVPWDSKSDENVETCTSSEQIKLDSNNDKETLKSKSIRLIFSTSFRKYIDANNGLKALTKTELTNTTNCLPPCSYWKYTQVGEGNVRDQTKFGKLRFTYSVVCHVNIYCSGYMFVLSSNEVSVEEETLIYDLISFVSEFGGSLGLFLGFSFFMLVSYLAPSLLIVKNLLKHL